MEKVARLPIASSLASNLGGLLIAHEDENCTDKRNRDGIRCACFEFRDEICTGKKNLDGILYVERVLRLLSLTNRTTSCLVYVLRQPRP